MFIMQVTGGPIQTHGYLVADEATGEAMQVDAPWGVADAVMAEVGRRGLRIVAIINTHGHWDHIGDNARFKALTGAPLYAHPLDAPLLKKPSTYGQPLPYTIEPTTPDRLLEHGQVVTVGRLSFTILHTPGHTPGGVCLFGAGVRALFSGDTLFDGSYGRTDLPGASERDIWSSLLHLAALPPDTAVYPGHGDTTSIGAQSWLVQLAPASIQDA